MGDNLPRVDIITSGSDKTDLNKTDTRVKENRRRTAPSWKIVLLIVSTCLVVIFLGACVAAITLRVIEMSNNYQAIDLSRTLIISDGDNLWALDVEGKNPFVFQTSKTGIAAFDVHTKIYWSEKNSSTISLISTVYANIKHTTLWKTHAFAVDYITNMLYVIDKSAGTLNVHDVHSKNTVLLSDLQRPHDLALDPAQGLMFILLQYNSILRCNMDGTLRKKIIHNSKVSAMAIERETKVIYWAENFISIGSSNYEGINQRRLTKIFTNIDSMTIFRNNLYWLATSNRTDEDSLTNELWSCAAINGICKNITNHKIFFGKPGIVKAISYQEPVDNPCNKNGGCEHLCLLTPNGGHSCTCNIGWTLNPDLKTCNSTSMSLVYIKENYIRAKWFDNNRESITDAIYPRKFYIVPLKYKKMIDFTYDYYTSNFFISDDTNIYKLNRTTEDYDGHQKRIFSVSQLHRIKYLEYDILYDFMYCVIEDIVNVRSITRLTIERGEVTQKTVLKSGENFFLLGCISATLYRLNWDIFFNTSSAVVRKSTIYNDECFTETGQLCYYNMYKLVSVDTDDQRIYWISNTTTTMIQHVDPNTYDRKIINLPIMKNPTSITLIEKWMFIGNSTGIWRFNKEDGKDAIEITANLEGDQTQLISRGKKYVNFEAYMKVEEDPLSETFNYFETHVGI